MELDTSSFESCNELSEIIVDENNPSYSSENGVLFNKDKTALIKYPARKGDSEYTIPSTVKRVEARAFEHCKLTNIVIPEGVTEFGLYAFYSCPNLESITIPSSIVSVGAGSFLSTKVPIVYLHGISDAKFVNSDLFDRTDIIYVKNGLSVEGLTYIEENFVKQVTSDKVGYDMYVRN